MALPRFLHQKFAHHLIEFAVENAIPQKVVVNIELDVRKDRIIPSCGLTSHSEIHFDLDIYEGGECIRALIGPRDMQWDRKTGEFIGAGLNLLEVR